MKFKLVIRFNKRYPEYKDNTFSLPLSSSCQPLGYMELPVRSVSLDITREQAEEFLTYFGKKLTVLTMLRTIYWYEPEHPDIYFATFNLKLL